METRRGIAVPDIRQQTLSKTNRDISKNQLMVQYTTGMKKPPAYEPGEVV